MAPKTKEQFQEIRLQKTATIKEAALELFAHNGYHSTSISQIAKAARVSKGLMYNYFESKEALLHAIIMEAVDEGEELMNQIFSATEDGYETLKLMMNGTFDWVFSQLHYWKLLTSLAFQTDVLTSLEPLLKKKQEAVIEQLMTIFQRMEMEKPFEEALLFAGLLDGVLLHYMQMEEEYPLETMKAMILEKYRPRGQKTEERSQKS